MYMDAKLSQEKKDGEVDVVDHPLKRVVLDMPQNLVTVGTDWTSDHLKTRDDGQVIRHLENR